MYVLRDVKFRYKVELKKFELTTKIIKNFFQCLCLETLNLDIKIIFSFELLMLIIQLNLFSNVLRI
jgi:hypothetical protein